MRDDLQSLIDEATPAPETTPDFAALTARAQRRTAIFTGVVSLVAVVALVSGFVLWSDAPGRAPAIDRAPTTNADGDQTAPVLPAGWQKVRLRDASFGVPGDWTIDTYGPHEELCGNSATEPTAMIAHKGHALTVCPARSYAATTLIAQPLSMADAESVPPEGAAATPRVAGTVSGHEASFGNDSVLTFWSEEADIWIQIGGPNAVRDITEQILATLEPRGVNRTRPAPDTVIEKTG